MGKYKQTYMLFDWVLVNEVPFQVQSLTKKKIGIHKTPTAMSYVRLHDVEPVTLTEEVLYKNGYLLTDEYQGYKQFYNSEDKVGIMFSGIGFYVVINNTIRHLNYVHEVQHMYEWRGIEKQWVI